MTKQENRQEAKKITFNVSKENSFSEWYSEIVEKAEITDLRYNVKGFVVIRPWGAMLIENMYKIYEKELQKTGHMPTFFPTVIPEENFKKEAGHVEGFTPQVFWLKEIGEEKLALRPTSETAFYQLYSSWIRGLADLPLKLYQRANVFRLETKATRPLIRAREFLWIEAHDAFSSKEEAEEQVQEDIAMTEKIMHQKFLVPFLPMKRPEWDKFPGAEYTIGSDTIMPDGKIIQQPSTHLLGQHFSKAFDIRFQDEKGESQYVWQTCYGPAISRILASVISMHGDDSGLVLPFSISPIQVVIIPIFNEKNSKKVLGEAEKIEKELEKAGIEAKIDSRESRPGEKFFFWEMKGVPLRIELGEKEINNHELTLYSRDNKEKLKIKNKNLAEEIKKQGMKLDARLLERADKKFKDSIANCKTKQEVSKALENKKIARFSFCSVKKDGEECAGFIEKELQARVMGTRHDKKEKAEGKCIICNKKAGEIVYAARSY
ncbi:MAG: proline--tRNA ligase [Nanoarchaeota archaeon]|nr:proline--tRNA ligase [Nanoarchaeota archaeon]MBU4086338.1 proline--tRNA ligase [Nanoarchaeota archaeon]